MQVMKRIYRPWYIRPSYKFKKINIFKIIHVVVQAFRRPKMVRQIAPNQYKEVTQQDVEYLKIV